MELHDYPALREDLSWDGVHYWLTKVRGKAADYRCFRCGKPARDWAYQHNAADEKVAPNGFPYSLDLSDYEPMCRSCHRLLDHEYLDHEATVRVATENLEKWRAEPGSMETLHKHGLWMAARGNSMKRECKDCGTVENAGNMAQHLKRSGHRGWREVVNHVQ